MLGTCNIALLSILLVAARPLEAGCPPAFAAAFDVGRDGTGYFVRTKNPGIGRRLYQEVGDFLAREAGVTILYFGAFTRDDIGSSEWRGPDPLSALKAFAASAGLTIETPQKDLWIIGLPEAEKNAAATVFAQLLDRGQERHVSPSESIQIERALVSQLPVREGKGSPEMSYIGVSYHWLTKEGRDVIFAQTGALTEATRSSPAQFQAFKVHLDRSGGNVKVECLWQTTRATGRMLPEVEEDFDGDGYRDFVFQTDADYTPSVILSGKDGHELLEFYGSQLAVEKNVAGPKRLAVEYIWDPTLDEPGPNPSPRAIRGPLVLSLAEDGRTFRPEKNLTGEQRKALSVPNDEPVADAGDALAAKLGTIERAKVFLLSPGLHLRKSSVEAVKMPRKSWQWHPRVDLANDPFMGHILFTYKSPGFRLAEEERRQQAVRHR